MATAGNVRYMRSLLILVEGGMFITKHVITTKLAGSDIDTVLKPFKKKLKPKFHQKSFDKLFPQSGKTDVDKWDLQLLLGVLDCVFFEKKDKQQKKALRLLKYLRNEVQGHTTSVSFEEEQYQEILDDTTDALETLYSCCGAEVQTQCKEIIDRYSHGPLDVKSAKDQMIRLQEVDDMFTTVLEKIGEMEKRIKEDISESTESTHKCVKEEGKSIKDKVSESEESTHKCVKEEGKSIKDKVSESTESTHKCVKEHGKSIKDKVSESTESTHRCVKEQGKSIKDKVSESMESTHKCVKEEGKSIKDNVSASEKRIIQAVKEELEKNKDGKVKKTIKIGCHPEINISGPSEEWIQLIETTLNFLFNKADKETQGSGDFEELKKRVNELLEPIKNMKDVRFKGSKQKCIMLCLEITSHDGLLELLTFLGSEIYQSHLINLAQALKEYYQLSDPIYISSQIPHASLMEIASELGLDINLETSSEASPSGLDVRVSQTEANLVSEDVNGDDIVPLSGKHNDTIRGIQLEMEYCSVEGFDNFWRLFQSSEFSQKIQRLQEELIRHYGEKIELKTSLDTGKLVAADISEEEKHANTAENIEMSLIDDAKEDKGTITSVNKERAVKSPKEFEEAVKHKNTAGNAELSEINLAELRYRREEDAVELQTALLEGLITYYKTSCSDTPLSPLHEVYTVPLVELYSQPRLAVRSTATFGQSTIKNSKQYVIKFRDVFFKDRKIPYRNIYVTGCSGMGKTSFCRKVTLTWCQAMSNDPCKCEDVEVMKKFDILFHLQLQHFGEFGTCDLVDMILEMVKCNLSRGYCFEKRFLESVLDTKRCLILLDGLDHWKHPDRCSRRLSENKPHNRFQGKCTVLTTLLPRTLSTLNSTKMDRNLEICDLTDRSVAEIEAKALGFLYGYERLQNITDEFDDLIHAAKLQEARYKPYILLQFICIWHDRKHLGDTRFEAYTNIVDFTLESHSTRLEVPNSLVRRDYIEMYIPECILETSTCHKNFPLLYDLGNVAFNAICKELTLETPDSTFDLEEVASGKTRLLTKEELEYFLKTGIILLVKDPRSLARVRHLLTFPHGLIQEYFAALYMATTLRIRTKRGAVLRKFWELPDVFEDVITRILKLIKDVNKEIYENIRKMIKSGKRTTGEDIQFIGKKLLHFVPEDAEELIEDCVPENKIGYGSFGNTMFKSEKLRDRFGVVAIKRCVPPTDIKSHLPATVRKDMYMTKWLHPFILPTIAVLKDVFEKQISFYFIQPYCEKGNLYSALHGNTGNIRLNQTQRLLILLQVALGIDFLHTEVIGTEKVVILHMDICTENILLDGAGNARLSDFGLTRETRDDPTMATSARPYYQNPDGAKRKQDDKEWDYYSFAVVILEMLTGQKPDGGRGTYLVNKDTREIQQIIDTDIWPQNDKESKDASTLLTDMVYQCKTGKNPEFEFRRDVVEKLRDKRAEEPVLQVRSDQVDRKCVLCMVNNADSKAVEGMHRGNYCEDFYTFKICISCEKQLHFYPLACCKCDGKLEPTIGHNWGAVLVAGNDTDKDQSENARIFTRDVNNMYKIVTSRAPLIMGIREENVKKIVPDTPGDETELLPKLREAMEWVKEAKPNTLVMYVSCHGKKTSKFTDMHDDCFILGSDSEQLTMNKFQEMLEDATSGNVKRVILFLDRCYPNGIELNGSKLIQLNAYQPAEETSIITKESIFTKYLIQGLKAGANKEKGGVDRKLYSTSDYISISSLMEFTSEQMSTEFTLQGIKAERYPGLFCKSGAILKEVNIAYSNPEEVTVDFFCDAENRKISLVVDLSEELKILKSELQNEFGKSDTCDVNIRRETDMKENPLDCMTVADILMAFMFEERVIVDFSPASTYSTQETQPHTFKRR